MMNVLKTHMEGGAGPGFASRICGRSLLLAALAFFFGPVTTAVWAQSENYLQDVGVPTYTTALPIESGFINSANGDLHLEIPLGSWPQRGGQQAKAALVYDSNIWNSVGYASPYNVPDAHGDYTPWATWGGWRVVSSGDSGGVHYVVNQNDSYCDGSEYDVLDEFTNWTWAAPDGTVHAFDLDYYADPPTPCNGQEWSFPAMARPALALDASGYGIWINATGVITVYAPDGTAMVQQDTIPGNNPAIAVEDTNGNYFAESGADTLGRSLVTESTSGSYIYLDVLNSQGSTSRYTLNTESINVCYANYFYYTITVIQSVGLPDGTSYLFNYEAGSCTHGLLDSMQLPTGGTINYSYTTFGYDYPYSDNVVDAISSRSTPDGAWNYGYTYDNSTCVSQGSGGYLNCDTILTVTKPSGDEEVYTYQVNGGAWPIQAQYYDSSANLEATIAQTFDYPDLGCDSSVDNCPQPPGAAVYVTKTSKTMTLPVPGGSINATTQYAYDTSSTYGYLDYGNLMQKSEWNFGSSTSNSADRTTTYTYLNGSNYIAAGILNRPASVKVTDFSGNPVASTTYCYDYANGCGGSSFANVQSVSNHDPNYGMSDTIRGDLTQEQRLVGGTNYVTKSMTYDITGQMLTETDWNANPTTYSYADKFFNDGGNTATAGSQNNPTTPTNAYPTTVTEANSLSTSYGYYWGTGQKALSKDPNNQTTYFHFYDSLNRPTSTILPNLYGSSCCGWTYKVYPSGSERQVDTGTGITNTTLSISCSPSAGDCRHDQTLLDTSGRTIQQLLVSDPDGQTTVDTKYDSNGRVGEVSNPYRSGQTEYSEIYDYGGTNGYDGLDRKIQITRTDGSVAHTYYGAAVTSTGAGGRSSQLCSGVGYPILNKDEAGNLRQTWTDGFGRLIEVDEPDSSGFVSASDALATCYSYDLNNNLLGVTQGSETRSFSYDMLSRLTAATNPESGTINYFYTTSGGTLCSGEPSNVCRRVAPSPNQPASGTSTVTTTYTYDTLNRLIQKSYTDSYSSNPATASVQYGYDGVAPTGCTPPSLTITNGNGRRTSMCDGSGATAWSYDPVGNTLEETRTIGSATKNLIYAYYLDSATKSVEYPSTRTVTYAPGGAQRPLSAIDSGSSINYATSIGYSPQGTLGSLTNGGTINLTELYNRRLQPCWQYVTTGTALPWTSTACNGSATAASILDLKYGFNEGSSDNGNVLGITNNRDSTRSQAFFYDSLNRIYQAAASTYATSPMNCWGEQFTTDRWGNMSNIGAITGTSAYNGCTQESLSLTINANYNNQINYMCYDPAGNLSATTGWPTCATVSYVYDAENRLISVAGVTYTYDGDGNRVEKSSGTLYWHGVSSDPVAETDSSGNTTNEYVFLLGKRIARRDSSGNVFYYFADDLGTAREIVQSGYTSPCYDADFYPYGGERTPQVNSCSQNYKFTGKERDSESGLDDFDARYYTSQYGRFMTPDWATAPTDVPYADFGNPQSLNLYGYVKNNPLSYADPDGHSIDPDVEANFATGIVKGLWNAFAGTVNIVTQGLLSGTPQPTPYDLPTVSASNPTQEIGMIATTVAIIAAPALGEESALAATEGATTRPTVPTEGIYEGPDATAPGKTYVGQSGRMSQRLVEHEAGKFPPGTEVKTTEVKGGKTAREVAEHKRIQELGGVKSQPGSQTSNVRNPIGKGRQHLLDEN